jgi:hypothetical protein
LGFTGRAPYRGERWLQADGEVADHCRRHVGGGGSVRRRRARFGAQLTQAERLREVVVGAKLQAQHPVDLGAPRGEHQDRDARLPADDPADLDPRQLGQHQVQHDELRALFPEPGERLAAVGGRDHPEAVSLERFRQRLAQVGSSDEIGLSSQDRPARYRRAVIVNGLAAQ